MNLSQKIRDSIEKYDNPGCAKVLFRQKNYRLNCPPYGRTNYSDTCVVENNCSPNYCRDPCSDKYCERVTSECSLRSPTGSLHKMRYSAINCSRPCRQPCPSPCCHSPYQVPIKQRCGPSYCKPKYSGCIDPCIDRYCNPCDRRFPRVCDSIILTKTRISRTRGRRCSSRCPPCPPFRSPCGNPRCRKPPCSYRYSRNCVKPRVCCDVPPCSPPVRCPSPNVPPLCDPCKPRRCSPPCRPTKCCPKPPKCLPDPCDPCLPKRPQYCRPRSRCSPPCDSFKYPCFYYDKSCNNICVKMVDGSAIPNSKNSCCKPLTSLFCSGSGTMFSISPWDRDKCRGDYNYRINNLRSLSNIRSVIFNDCNDRCRPEGRYRSPCPPDRSSCPPCPPCPPRGLSGSCRPFTAPGNGVCRPSGPSRDPCGLYRPGRDPCRPCRDPCGPCGPRNNPCSPCEPEHDACGPGGSSRGRCGVYRPGRDPCEPCGPRSDACTPCEPGHDACGPCGSGRDPCGPYRPGRDACGPCGPGSGAYGRLRSGRDACEPCSPTFRPKQRDLDCYGYESCESCPPRRPCSRVKSLCFNDCNYESRRSGSDNCERPKTCPTPITPECITSCRCSGCTMFGPSYCVQRSNSRVPCLCAKYPCLPKFC